MNTEELKSAAGALKILFNCFQSSGSVDVDGQAEAYLWAVKDYELPDVMRAVHRFSQGEVVNFDGKFCPSTAQLCQEVRARKEIREIVEKRERGGGEVVPLKPGSAFLRQYNSGKGA